MSTPKDIYINNNSDQTITWMGKAKWYTDKDWFLVCDFHGVDHQWGNPDILEAGALTGTGHGSWVGMIWMGRHIDPKGWGDRDVKFEFNGHMLGQIIAGGGSAKADITAVVKNKSANSKATSTVGSWSANTLGAHYVNSNFSETVKTELDADDEYIAYLKVKVEISSFLGVKAMASADFGPFDGDEGQVELNSIKVKKM